MPKPVSNDRVANPPRFPRETRRFSHGHVDAIFPKLKFRKRQKRTLRQHEVPVPDAAGFWRRVLHAPREVVDALEDDDVPADRRVREGRTAAAASCYSRRRATTSTSEDAAAAAAAELGPRAALPPRTRS